MESLILVIIICVVVYFGVIRPKRVEAQQQECRAREQNVLQEQKRSDEQHFQKEMENSQFIVFCKENIRLLLNVNQSSKMALHLGPLYVGIPPLSSGGAYIDLVVGGNWMLEHLLSGKLSVTYLSSERYAEFHTAKLYDATIPLDSQDMYDFLQSQGFSSSFFSGAFKIIHSGYEQMIFRVIYEQHQLGPIWDKYTSLTHEKKVELIGNILRPYFPQVRVLAYDMPY